MRHLIGVILAIAAAAAIFFAASWAWLKVRPPLGVTSFVHAHGVIEGFAVLAGVGLLAGLLMAVPSISPLACGLPGLALLGSTALYLTNVPRAMRYIPLRTHPYGAGFAALLETGLLALVGAAMVVPLFVPSRWRRRRAVAVVSPGMNPEGNFPGLQATQTMTGNHGLMSDWVQTRPQQRIDPDGPMRSQPPWGPAEYG
jgi:hypothetical protein